MNISDIIKLPTTVDGIHESCFRSYHILKYVSDMLLEDCPAPVVIKIIEDFQGLDDVNKDTTKA